MTEIIKDIVTLKRLAKAGIIELHDHTGKTVCTPFGAKIKAYYVQKVNLSPEYADHYCDGSFYPYVKKK